MIKITFLKQIHIKFIKSTHLTLNSMMINTIAYYEYFQQMTRASYYHWIHCSFYYRGEWGIIAHRAKSAHLQCTPNQQLTSKKLGISRTKNMLKQAEIFVVIIVKGVVLNLLTKQQNIGVKAVIKLKNVIFTLNKSNILSERQKLLCSV